MGFETDLRLCERIRERTGIPATSSVLALNELLALGNVRRFGLVSPYTDDVQQRIIANYRAAGIDCRDERHLGISVNFDFSTVEPAAIEQMIQEVAVPGVEAVVTYCTNLRAAQLAETVEAKLGIPLLDTVSTVVWKMLRMTGEDPARVRGWGRLFRS
jgi:maleate isomerase